MGKKKCKPCEGTGVVEGYKMTKEQRMAETVDKCKPCNGTGRVSSGKPKKGDLWASR